MTDAKISLKLDILNKLILIRLAELAIAKHYPEQTMRCPTHLCLGQEATGAVFGALARKEDLFFGNYRSHGHYLGKGGNLLNLFLELLGSTRGCSGGMGGSMHLVDSSCGFAGSSAIVSATVPQAAGAALAFKLRRHPGGAVVFLGDAAMEQGVVYETINFSLLHRLPIIFVCENNRLAINTPIELRSCGIELSQRFSSMGLFSVKASGVSIDQMISAAETSFAFIRSGRGPFLVECFVSRWAAHVGPAYEGPVDLWWQDPESEKASLCPIAHLIHDLIKKGIITSTKARKLHEDALKETEDTFQKAVKMPPGEIPELENIVFSSPLLSSLPEKELLVTSVLSNHDTPSKIVNPF